MNVINIVKSFSRSRHRKIVSNVAWMISDNAVRLVVGTITFLWLVRYLHPEDFGVLNYAFSFVALFAVFATLELPQIAIKRLVKREDQKYNIIGTAFFMRLVGGLVLLVLAVIGVMIVKPNDLLTYWMVVAISIGYLLQSGNVINYWFQSKIKSKYTVIPGMIATVLGGVIRLTLIFFKAPLFMFAAVMVIDTILIMIGLFISYRLDGQNFFKWRFNWQLAKGMLKEVWPLMIAGVAIAVYMRIDRVLLSHFVDDWSVGIYAVAAKLSELWYIFPVAITSTLFPKIVGAKMLGKEEYKMRLQLLYGVLAWLSIIVAILTTIFSRYIIQILYGSEYMGAAVVLSIHIWTLLFVSLGLISGHYLIIEKLTKIWLVRAIVGAVTSVALNLILIPRFGAVGAAIATLSAQAVSVVIILVFRSCRSQLKMFIGIFDIYSLKRIIKTICFSKE
jgi:polysaccharide transporter, PST family